MTKSKIYFIISYLKLYTNIWNTNRFFQLLKFSSQIFYILVDPTKINQANRAWRGATRLGGPLLKQGRRVDRRARRLKALTPSCRGKDHCMAELLFDQFGNALCFYAENVLAYPALNC